MINLSDKQNRLNIIQSIKSEENKQRKQISVEQYEIFNDRQHKYVLQYLKQQFSEKTVLEMPVISSINLARRVVKQEASLYKSPPKRSFQNMTDDQAEKLGSMYEDFGWNTKYMQANEYFKLQLQTHIMWALQDGCIKSRVLLPHHLDVIPDPVDPENGAIYIISSFDKSLTDGNPTLGTKSGYQGIQSDNINQAIADADDYKASLEKYVVWSKDFNFIMDGNANITSGESIENPIGGIIPIVDAASSKDFEYWVRQGQSVTDFSVQFNGMISDVANVVRMQGWGQAVFTGPEGSIPESIQLGPNFVIRLPTDPNNPSATSDFKYVTANADIAGSLEFLKTNLSMFLSSRGVDPKTISFDGASESFSSGFERLLSMIEKFEASKADIDLFTKVEKRSFDIIKTYLNTYQGTELLNEEFSVGTIPEDAYMTVTFEQPQLIKTEKENLELIKQKMELGLESRLAAYMSLNDVDEQTAIKNLAEIDGENKRPDSNGV